MKHNESYHVSVSGFQCCRCSNGGIVLSETPSFITIDLILRIYGWLQSGFPNTMASRQQVHWCVPNYLETLAARKYGLLLIAHTSHVCCCDVPTFGFFWSNSLVVIGCCGMSRVLCPFKVQPVAVYMNINTFAF